MPVLTLAVLFIAATLAVWSAADRGLRVRQIDEAVTQGERPLDGEMRAVGQWAERQLADARYWAADPQVVEAVQQLSTTDDLLTDPAQADLRSRLRPFIDRNGLAGYFAVRLNGINLASSRDSNVGTVNLVKLDFPDVFDDLVDGAPGITPPQVSDVPLDDVGLFTEDGSLPETMFVGAPIVSDGEVIAVFLLRLVPSSDLTTVLRDDNPSDGIDHVVFSESGNAVTGSTTVDPLDVLSIAGQPSSELFEDAGSGKSIDPETASPPERLELWTTSAELGLGVLTT